MAPVDRANVSVEAGVDGDWRGKQKQRQVTVLFAEDWAEAVGALDPGAPWTIRRATLLVSGVSNLKRAGDVLAVGPVRLLVTGETEPCKRMEEQLPGLWEALKPDWRGGVTAQVVGGGEIAVGDEVAWIKGEA